MRTPKHTFCWSSPACIARVLRSIVKADTSRRGGQIKVTHVYNVPKYGPTQNSQVLLLSLQPRAPDDVRMMLSHAGAWHPFVDRPSRSFPGDASGSRAAQRCCVTYLFGSLASRRVTVRDDVPSKGDSRTLVTAKGSRIPWNCGQGNGRTLPQR